MPRLKAAQIDHLSPGYRYAILDDFTDLAGTLHRAGEVYSYQSVEMDLEQKRVFLKFEGKAEVPLPASQRMRPLFAERELPAPPERIFTPVPAETPAQPSFEGAVVLARAHRFDEAAAMIQSAASRQWQGPEFWKDTARWLAAAARRLAGPEPLAARWLYERAIESFYPWSSQATSGGEGAERATHIRELEREYREFLKTLPSGQP